MFKTEDKISFTFKAIPARPAALCGALLHLQYHTTNLAEDSPY